VAPNEAGVKPPELQGEPGWTEVWPFPFKEARRSFTGLAGMHGVAIRYFKRGSDGSLAAKVWFGPGTEGAPGRLHGGGTLTVLDEAIGGAAWVAGYPVLTARLDTRFRAGVPLGEVLIVETKLLRVGGRTVKAWGRLVGREGLCHAEAEGVFARLSPDKVRDIFGDSAQNLPETS